MEDEKEGAGKINTLAHHRRILSGKHYHTSQLMWHERSKY